MSAALNAGLAASLASLLVWGLGLTWQRIRRNAALLAEADRYKRLRQDFLYPQLPPEVRADLDALAAASSVMSTALRFRGQLLADRLRTRSTIPDLGIAWLVRELVDAADSVEAFALANEMCPFTTWRHVLAATATELASLERELERKAADHA